MGDIKYYSEEGLQKLKDEAFLEKAGKAIAQGILESF